MQWIREVAHVWRRPLVPGGIAFAIGASIAVTCALFSIVDGLLYRPLPFPDSDRIVEISYRQDGAAPSGLAYLPEFADRRSWLKDQLNATDLLELTTQAGFRNFFELEAMRDAGLIVTGVDHRFFDVMQTNPQVGRRFTEDDERNVAALATSFDRPEALPIIIGHALAVRLTGSDSAALGLRLLAGRRVDVIGVMPAGVKFPGETNVWAPVDGNRARIATYARIRRAVTTDTVNAAFPELRVRAIREVLRPGGTNAVLMLFATSALLLVLAWVQVGAMSLSRSVQQVRDLGVRIALGASRRRLMFTVLIQELSIALVAVVGSGLAVGPLTQLLIAALPDELSRGQYLSPDLRTVVFGAVMSAAGLVLLMVAPLFIVSRIPPVLAMRGNTDGAAPADHWRTVVVSVQVGLTAVLLYVSALAIHGYVRAATFDYGFRIGDVLLFQPPTWARSGQDRDQSVAAFYEQVRRLSATATQVSELSGVGGVAGFFAAPLGIGITPEELPVRSYRGSERSDVRVRTNVVGFDFVRVMGARILAGSDGRTGEASRVTDPVLINRALAERLSPGTEMMPAWMMVLGQPIRTQTVSGRIVGVIDDLVQKNPVTPPSPELFKLERKADAFTGIAIRVTTHDEPAVRALLEREWGVLSPRHLRWMRSEQERVLAPFRSQSVLLGAIGVMAMPITTIGLLTTLIHYVRTRERELAIRLSLGASGRDIARLFAARTVTMLGGGILIGLVVAISITRTLAHLFFGMQAIDALALTATAGALVLIGTLATWIPVRRAGALDPASSLRADP